VAAVAKKDIKPGEKLDCIGGYTVYGIIEDAQIMEKEDHLPLGLVEIAAAKRSIRKGEVIRCSDVELDENSMLAKLRREQEMLS
jgi:predicted homoserine dehydrogenase-like protein